MSSLFVYLIVLASSSNCINTARILGVFPVTVKSHFNFNHAILRSLHDAGHHVTMVSPFPQCESKTENFTYVDSLFDSVIYVGRMTIEEVKELPLSMVFHIAKKNLQQYCYNVMKLPEIKEALNSPQKLYDVMIVELWFEYECYLPIAEKLGIPVVGTVTLPTWQWADVSIGNPYNPAVVPGLFASKVYMNVVERIQNLWRYIALDYYYHTILREPLDQFYRDQSIEKATNKEISLVFYNNHASLQSRPLVINAIEIGGIHVQPAKPLPQHLQKFIDEAQYGVVFFSMGSVFKVSSISSQLRQEFVSAFASIPQRVIWKFEEPIEDLPPNVIISEWLPQRDILEHKNVIAFMSHCGVGGTYEAIVTGTPVVTLPLVADQNINADILQHHGAAVHLDLHTATKGKILAALNTVINDTSYRERIRTLSLSFKDRPIMPQQQVVYWTEYVIRHNGTRQIRAIGADMHLYKYLMLDIATLGVAATSVAVFLIFLALRKIYSLFARESKNVDRLKKRE